MWLGPHQARALQGSPHCEAVCGGDRAARNGGGGDLQSVWCCNRHPGAEGCVWLKWVQPEIDFIKKSDLIKVDDTKGRDWQDRPCSGDFERLFSVFFSNPCTLCPAQTTRTCLSWWGRWTWTPSLEHWSCISVSCRSLFSLTSCTPTLLEALVSCSSVFLCHCPCESINSVLLCMSVSVFPCSSLWQCG